jgi:hypothetical protein
MGKLICPHCGAVGFSVWQKLFLGPARSVTCAACGARASVPAWSMVIAIPVVVALVGGLMLDTAALRWIIIAAGIAVATYLQIALVPLIRR